MRIAIDIDSTLHPYWDQLSELARRRFGITLPYETQYTWGIGQLRPEQLRCIIEETHRPERVLAAVPYPGAVETVRTWKAAGHYIHVTSHRAADAHGCTTQWLDRIGLPYDDVHCSDDKLTRCVELGIDLLVDDSPVNLEGALERGIRVATLDHPWNRDVREEEDVVSAPTWPELRERLRGLLGG